MKWSDIPTNPSPKMLRQFACAWLGFFLLWAAWLGIKKGHVSMGYALAVLAILGGVAGLLKPSLLRWVFVAWMVLVFPIGWLISLVMLLILFYGLFTPVALFLRLRGRDALRLKPPASETSLWLAKHTPLDVRSYFKQY